MASDEEWQTVRRRRGGKSTYQAKLNQLAIPVVPLAINALRAEEDEKEREKRKLEREKKKKRKAAAASAAASQEQSSFQAASAPVTKPSSREAEAAKSVTDAAAAGSKAAIRSEDFWFLQIIYSVIAWLKQLLGLGAQKKKRSKKPKAVAPQPQQQESKQEVKAEPATKAEASTPSAKAAAAAAATSKDLKAAKPEPSKPAADISAAVAKPAKQQPAAASKADSKVASTPAPAAAAPAAESKPAASSSAPHGQVANPKTQQQQQQAAQQAAPKAPAKPIPACDEDWARGRFVYCEVPHAHADVVSSVALAGEVVLSAGYDGAVKVWSWKQGGQLTHLRNLVGHSGRVEALAVDPTASRGASSGRDSALKVWDLSRDSSAAAASYYVYDSVKCMAVDWSTSRAALGSKSGSVAMWNLDTGRKAQVLRAHRDEVCALKLDLQGGGHRLVSGSRDATVRVWDVRDGAGREVACLRGIRGRACSLDMHGDLLYVGDFSSTIKVFDLRTLVPLPSLKLPNAPIFAGAECPVAALHYSAAGKVLVSSSIGWWTNKRERLEEAPEDTEHPMACLNIHACGKVPASGAQLRPAHFEYVCTVRMCPGIATCMDNSGAVGGTERMLLGTSSGALAGISLVRGSSNKLQLAEGLAMEEGLPLGVEEFSDEEDEEENEEEDEE